MGNRNRHDAALCRCNRGEIGCSIHVDDARQGGRRCTIDCADMGVGLGTQDKLHKPSTGQLDIVAESEQ